MNEDRYPWKYRLTAESVEKLSVSLETWEITLSSPTFLFRMKDPMVYITFESQLGGRKRIRISGLILELPNS